MEHGTFTPFVMSTSGGMGPSMTMTMKQLAALLAEKNDTSKISSDQMSLSLLLVSLCNRVHKRSQIIF